MEEVAACVKAFPDSDPEDLLDLIRNKGVRIISCEEDETIVFWHADAPWVFHQEPCGRTEVIPAWDSKKGRGVSVMRHGVSRKVIARVSAGHIRRAIRKLGTGIQIPSMFLLGRYCLSIQYATVDGRVRMLRQKRVDIEAGEAEEYLVRHLPELRGEVKRLSKDCCIVSANALVINASTNVAEVDRPLIKPLTVSGWAKKVQKKEPRVASRKNSRSTVSVATKGLPESTVEGVATMA